MPREKLRGGLTVKTFTLDQQRITEFERLCAEVGKNMSQYIRDLINEELEKKVKGTENPLNVLYRESNNNNTILIDADKPDEAMKFITTYIERPDISLLEYSRIEGWSKGIAERAKEKYRFKKQLETFGKAI